MAIGACAPSAGFADPVNSPRVQEPTSLNMRVFDVTPAPSGFVVFCQRMPEECKQGSVEKPHFTVTAERLTELDAINRAVNREITPATDMEIYGEVEYWTIPATRGDCEDYALLKRKRLMARGWPSSLLLMTVVRDEKGEGHAVLTARTVYGDLILDNKVNEVKVWHRTGYEFLIRQSYRDPLIWLSLDPGATRTLSIAGVRNQR
jgi:predicted transglutaminase-like cysteine proteinase